MIVCPVCGTFRPITDDMVERGTKTAFLHTCKCGRTRLSTQRFTFVKSVGTWQLDDCVTVPREDVADPVPILVSEGRGSPAGIREVEKLVQEALASAVLES